MRALRLPLLLSLLLLAPPASAQVGRWRAGWHPGAGFVVGESRRLFKHSFAFQAEVEGPLPERWLRWGFELGHNPNHHSKDIEGVVLRVLQLTPFVRATAWREQTEFGFRLGIGYYRTWNRDTVSVVGGQQFKIVPPDRNHFGFNLGGSVTEWYEGRFGLGVDLRYHHLLQGDDDFQYLLPSLRLLYAF